MTQERRRYGFVLERQCSLAKHWIAYHTSGKNCLSSHLDSWDEVSSSREFLPPNVENMFAKNIKVLNDEKKLITNNRTPLSILTLLISVENAFLYKLGSLP